MRRETRLRPARGGNFFGSVAVMSAPQAPPVLRHVCFLCRRSVDNGRRFAICAECDDAHEIRSSWGNDYAEHRAQRRNDPERECGCPGWLWMNEESDASFNIECCDTCAVFESDDDAAKTVVARCNIRGVEWSE